MAQIINTNIASLVAQRNLNNSQTANAAAMRRLSSGLRINSAKDDAAGLAISTRYTSVIRGIAVAIRNAGDGISLAQTAEGALSTITGNLQRIRELALQSVNATNSDADRQSINSEVQQLIAEIARKSETTNFNGTALLNGELKSSFQIGTNAGETVSLQVGAITTDRLGSADAAGVSAVGNTNALGNGDLIINGVQIGPTVSADDTASTASASASAIAKVATINRSSDDSGVVAKVIDNYVAGTSMTAASSAGQIILNDVTIELSTGGNNAAADRQAVVTAINMKSDQTGVMAVDTGTATGGVALVAADGRNIVYTLVEDTGTFTAATLGVAAAGTYAGGYTLSSEIPGKEIVITGGNNTGNGDLANAGMVSGTYSDGVASVTNTAQNVGLVGGTFSASTLDMAVQRDFGVGNTAQFSITVGNVSAQIDLDSNFATTDLLLAEINSDLANGFGTNGVLATASMDAAGHLIFTATGGGSNETIAISAVSAAGRFTDLVSSGGVTGSAASAETLAAGDIVLNGVVIAGSVAGDDTASDTTAETSSADASGISIAAAINKSTDDTGVTASVNATQVIGGTTTTNVTSAQSGVVYINNVATALISAGTADRQANVTAAIEAINAISGQTGVVATDNGVSITLTAADGRNISIVVDTDAAGLNANFDTAIGLDETVDGIGVGDIDGGSGPDTFVVQAETTSSTVRLMSAGTIDLKAGATGRVGVSSLGYTEGDYGATESGQFIADVDVSTMKGAERALIAVDNALDFVSSETAKLGAVQNRLESAVAFLAINSTNLSEARSRILDADFAAEAAELSRTQVLQQAGISILAQANAQPQQVLALLQ